MDKLDRLGWADGFAFESHGARVGVRVSDPALLARVRDRLPPGAEVAASPVVDGLYSLIGGSAGAGRGARRYTILYDNSTRVLQTEALDEALGALESQMHLAIAAHARGRLFVHAGVVVWEGRGIMIPGRTHTGKSTLVEALIRAGATYYSDEYAVLDGRAHVTPYLKSLSRRARGDAPARVVPAAELNVDPDAGPVPVALVVLTHHRAEAEWRPRRLSPGRALLGLLNNTVAARLKPGEALRMLNPVAAGAVTLHGARGEADAAAARILLRASRASLAPPPVAPAMRRPFPRSAAV